MTSWSPLSLSTGSNDKESYLTSLTAYLSAHPPGSAVPVSLAPSNLSLSSPEGSDGSSPSSSEGTGTAPASVQSGAANGDKRKPATQKSAPSAIKDRRASSGSGDDGIHTHPTHPDSFDDDDDESQPGKGGKTSERRRAQNRQAQRAFRGRKEKHLKDLEERVFSLEQQTTEQVTENTALKQLLERLQSENERLKVFESAFSFTYAKDVSTSSSMPSSTQFGGKPPTPPTAQDEVDDVSSFGIPAFGGVDGHNPFSHANLFPTSSSDFALPTAATGSGLDESLYLHSLSEPSPSSTAGESTSGSSTNLATPPETSIDLFSGYRDSSGGFGAPSGGLSSFPDFDSLFGPSASDTEPNYSAYIASPPPSSLPLRQPAMVATAGKPSPDKFSFDVDGLCSDLAAKATCQEAARHALRAAMSEDATSSRQVHPTL